MDAQRPSARATLLVGACLVAGGCLPAARIREDIRSGAVRGALVENVPFVRQRRDTCGPAALASVMLRAGVETSEEAISEALRTRENRGTVTFDLALHARAKGLIAVQRYEAGAEEMRAAVRAGVPPLVMLGGLLSIIGRYHYAVITGYDETRRLWIMHYGVRPDVVMGFERLERLRRNADGWTLYVLHPDERTGGMSPGLHLEIGLAAEKLGQADSARHHYSHAAWNPESPQAMLNLGNLAMSTEDLERAERMLRRSLELRPDFPAAKNNLAWVLLKCGEDLAEAERLAREAAGDERVRPYALDTLVSVLEAAGRPAEADRARAELAKLKEAKPCPAPRP